MVLGMVLVVSAVVSAANLTFENEAFKLALDGKPVQIRLGNLQYVETSMTAAEAKNAFAVAEL